MKKILLIILFILLGVWNSYAQTITIERKFTGKGCIMGYLLVNNQVVCYTLELPWIGNINTISSIPAGRYTGHIRTDGNRGWRIELDLVEGRTNVQIHVGNYTTQTQGCTLIGTEAKVDNCSVLDSGTARTKVQQAFANHIDKVITVIYK